jgi:hypothetical protein
LVVSYLVSFCLFWFWVRFFIPSLSYPEAWGGINSLQLGLSIVWTMARDRAFSLQHLSRKLSASPAKLLTIDDVVGTIEVGKLANFVIWDPEAQFTVWRYLSTRFFFFWLFFFAFFLSFLCFTFVDL